MPSIQGDHHMSLDDRLRNWGRWARGGLKLQTCGSAEGRYRSNWRQWVRVEDIQQPGQCDIFDAEEVEKAWVRMGDFKEKKLLKLKYVFCLTDEGYTDDDGRFVLGLCQRLRIKHRDLFAMLARSRHNLLQSIEYIERESKKCLTFSKKSVCSGHNLNRSPLG